MRSLWETNQALGSKNTAQIAVSDCKLQQFQPPGGAKSPFLSPSYRSLKPWKGSRFHHPKEVTKNCKDPFIHWATTPCCFQAHGLMRWSNDGCHTLEREHQWNNLGCHKYISVLVWIVNIDKHMMYIHIYIYQDMWYVNPKKNNLFVMRLSKDFMKQKVLVSGSSHWHISRFKRQ